MMRIPAYVPLLLSLIVIDVRPPAAIGQDRGGAGISVSDSAGTRLHTLCPLLFDPSVPEEARCEVAGVCVRDLQPMTDHERDVLRSICPDLDLGASTDPLGPDPRLSLPFVEPCLTSLALYTDNDVFLDGPIKFFTPFEIFAGLNEDRNYTGSLTLQASGLWVHHRHLDAPLNFIDRQTGFAGRHTRAALVARRPAESDLILKHANQSHSFVIGHTILTPDDLQDLNPIPDDRPYASMQYFATRKSTASPYDAYKSELVLGILGLGIADPVQSWVHERLRERNDKATPHDPKGWEHQIQDGGEPTIKYTVSTQRLAGRSDWHDLTTSAEASAGYYTNIGASTRLRLGRVKSYFWTFDDDPNGSFDQALRPDEWELFLWGSLRTRLWAYNVLLQGQGDLFQESAATVPARNVERVVVDGRMGVTLNARGFSLTSVLVAGRSPEFRGDKARSHYWGGLFAAFMFAD